jgi:hypothetical protein
MVPLTTLRRHKWITVIFGLLVVVPIPNRAFADEASGILHFSLGLNAYLNDYLTYVKGRKQKPEDWYAHLPREKQDLLIKALRKLEDREISTGCKTEQPLGKKCRVINKILDPCIPNRPREFSIMVSDKDGNRVKLEGELDVKDAGSTVVHNCEKFGTDDIAYVRHKLVLTIKGGGLDLKGVIIDNHKTYTLAYVNR